MEQAREASWGSWPGTPLRSRPSRRPLRPLPPSGTLSDHGHVKMHPKFVTLHSLA
jgi:hypothetical protein